ncbi:hypothetical protein SAMN05444161_3141 [Rhizobiales bacterium GAS191]|nr:hypothetical protein SAMN05444161_3141 [Rhizobiales bacterium GAS191]
MWERAGKGFQGLLDDLKPNTIIVLGKTMWSLMPDADIYLTKDVQGYKTDGGGMAMCWAVEHPSAGLSWRRLAQLIAFATNREIVELD